MKIGTGYFAKAKEYHDMGYSLVNVARKRPWFISQELFLNELWTKLCPTEEILKLKDDPFAYTAMYKDIVLNNVKRQTVFEELLSVAQKEKTDKVVLLCYESPEKFCHRHLIADWLNEGTGMNVQEIKIPTPNGSTQTTFSFFKETSK